MYFNGFNLNCFFFYFNNLITKHIASTQIFNVHLFKEILTYTNKKFKNISKLLKINNYMLQYIRLKIRKIKTLFE